MSTPESQISVDPSDVRRVLDDFSDSEVVVKAHFVERTDTQESRVIPDRVDDPKNVFSGHLTVAPPHDPETLCLLLEHSNALRQNIDAYVTNIDAFGHRFDPVFDLTADEVNDKVSTAMFLDRLHEKEEVENIDDVDVQDKELQPSDEEVEAKKEEIKRGMRLEKSRLENFFEFCCVDMSFVTLRRRTRQDIEAMGNGYWEILRNGVGQIAQFVYIPGFSVRLLPLDRPHETQVRTKVSDLSFEKITMRRRFRRFIQVHEGSDAVFFKEFGDPRIISAKTGKMWPSVEDMKKEDPKDRQATEILHFQIHSPRSPYGIPRWIGTLLSVLGSRQSEEVNFLYFENKSVPPLALLVSGGRLSDRSIGKIEKYIENNIKGKKNFHKILILEAAPAAGTMKADNTGRVRIELKPLTDAQHKDALFQNYDQRNMDKVGQSFRLPRMLRGDIRDFNRSTAEAALMFAEMQVFQPEREEFDFVINRKILTAMRVRYWKFKSNSPVTRDPKTMAEVIKNLSNAGVLIPEEARELAGDVFNRDFKRIDAPWVKQPLQMTLAGIDGTLPANQDRGDGAEKADLTVGDLATGGGLLQPAQGKPRRRRRRRDPEFKLERWARVLVELRRELREAEKDEAEGLNILAKVDEMERETVHVPADEFSSWFEDEDEPGEAHAD